MVFRLRYLHHDFELPPGHFLIGRSPDCQLSLDDPLVSRKHALLIVSDDVVELQDLGSRNGVLVNDERVGASCVLKNGDRITIGSQQMVIATPPPGDPAVRNRSASFGQVTLAAKAHLKTQPPVLQTDGVRIDRFTERTDEGTSKRDVFRLLGGVADKALALGRAEEAERLLSTLLDQVLLRVRHGGEVDEHLVEQAGFYSARLAGATGKGAWVDYVVELYSLRERPCAGLIIDELHTVLRKVKDIDLPALRAYVALLRARSQSFGPADRFLVQRVEGLERLVSVH
ncbi:MAG: FHA domain-containing protein [Polyangiaceae bacterium]|jgi:hypothetical protein|nr:FHA domain-containing protein [Polyangiaceae bacterium]